jgi:DNA-binding MarR family transcriptional regulator
VQDVTEQIAIDIRSSGGVDVSPSRLDLSPLPSFVGYMLRRAQMLVFDDFIRAMAPLGLRPASFSVLTLIATNPGATQSAISEALGLQRTNLVGIIDALEERGLARREPAKNDRRSHALYVSEKGKRLLRQAMDVQAEHEARVLQRLGSNERAQLLGLLHKMLDEPLE